MSTKNMDYAFNERFGRNTSEAQYVKPPEGVIAKGISFKVGPWNSLETRLPVLMELIDPITGEAMRKSCGVQLLFSRNNDFVVPLTLSGSITAMDIPYSPAGSVYFSSSSGDLVFAQTGSDGRLNIFLEDDTGAVTGYLAVKLPSGIFVFSDYIQLYADK